MTVCLNISKCTEYDGGISRVSCCICMDCISAGQNETHTTELPSSFEVEIVSAKV